MNQDEQAFSFLCALSLCFATSAFALSGDLAGNTRVLEDLGELNMQLKTALTEDNATGLASLFTDEAVCVAPRAFWLAKRPSPRALTTYLRARV